MPIVLKENEMKKDIRLCRTSEKVNPHLMQVGTLRASLGLSVKQTLPIPPDARSRICFVDYAFSEFRTPQVSYSL